MFKKEEEMYEHIAKWLKDDVGCTIVLREKDPLGSSPVRFRSHKTWEVDVAGRKGWELHAIEAKLYFDSKSFAIAIHQAKYYQKAFNFVYLCFPMDELHEKITTVELQEFREMVRAECVEMNIGLISVDDKGNVEIEKNKDAKNIMVDETKTNPSLNLALYQEVMNQLSYHIAFAGYESRALLVRDLVLLINKNRLSLNGSDLATEFETKSQYAKNNILLGQNFHKASVVGKGLPTVEAAISLGFIGDEEKTGLFYLTTLGELLVTVCENDEQWNQLSLGSKGIFYSLVQQYDTVQLADDVIQMEFENRRDVTEDMLKNIVTEKLSIPWDGAAIHFAANSGIVPFKWVRGEKKWKFDENFLKE